MTLIYGFDEFSNLNENKKVDNRVTCIKDFNKVLNKSTCKFSSFFITLSLIFVNSTIYSPTSFQVLFPADVS